jgi:hypothetical protein
MSYVKENYNLVRKLANRLEEAGIYVWLDKDSIGPGMRWKTEIKKGISEGDFFIACFSKEYNEKLKTYMNEELNLAIDELRQRSKDKAWFIPVLLSRCEVPDWDIGAGETLNSIQWIELYDDWELEVNKIISVLLEKPLSEILIRRNFYRTPATSATPALILYLIDIGYNSNRELSFGKTQLQVVNEALRGTIIRMVQRSTKGVAVVPRFHVGIFLYSDRVYDVYGGIKPISQIARIGFPNFKFLDQKADQRVAFITIEELIKSNIENYLECPAPMVCHITSGEYKGSSPEDIVERIMNANVADGTILIENVLIDEDSVLLNDIKDIKYWEGIKNENELSTAYARQLFRMSSVLPEAYSSIMSEMGFNKIKGSRMLFPGSSTDLIDSALAMSAVTLVTHNS